MSTSEFDRWVSENNIPETFEYSKGWWDYIELVRRLAARLAADDVRVIGHYIVDTPPPCERLPMPAVAITLPGVVFALRFDLGSWSLKHREIGRNRRMVITETEHRSVSMARSSFIEVNVRSTDDVLLVSADRGCRTCGRLLLLGCCPKYGQGSGSVVVVGGATQIYDQLAQGTAQQLDQGVQQLAARIDPTADDIATHAEQAEREGRSTLSPPRSPRRSTSGSRA